MRHFTVLTMSDVSASVLEKKIENVSSDESNESAETSVILQVGRGEAKWDCERNFNFVIIF